MITDVAAVVDLLPALLWTALPDGQAEFINRQWSDYTGMSPEEAQGVGWVTAVHPDDVSHLTERWDAFVGSGEAGEVEARLRRFDGAYRWFLFRGNPMRDETGTIVKWCGTNIDIEERKQAETQLAYEKHLLEMIASGSSLQEVLETLCRFVEQISPDCLCGVYPIDRSDLVFQRAVAPSLPASYVEPIKGWPGSEGSAPWGIAAVEKIQVIVPDVEADPLWSASGYRDHMVAHGLRSVWSTPISSLDGPVLGTLCIYQRKPATPTPHQQELISHATHIAGIALNRARADEALTAREVEVRRAHAQLSEGQRLSKTGTYSWIMETDEVIFSDELRRIFGLNNDVVVRPEILLERVHPDDLPRALEQMEAARGGRDVDYGIRLRMPDASIKYLRESGHQLRDQDGRIEFVGSVQDVTQSKLAEAALTASEAELRQTLGQLTEGQRLSKTGSFTSEFRPDLQHWSDELYRIYEIDPATPPTIDAVRDRVHPDDLASFNAEMQQRIEGRGSDFIFRIVTPTGRLKHLRAVAHLTEHVVGHPSFMGVVQDITENKLAEAALIASEAELRRAYAQLSEAQRLSKTGSYSWFLDTDEVIFSDELRRIFGLNNDVVVRPEILLERVHPDDVLRAIEQMEAARGGRDVDFVVRLRLPDGSIKYLREFGHQLRDQEGRAEFVGSVQDVTESKLVEAALTASEAELRRAYDYLTEAQRLSRTGSFTWDVFADEHNWSEEIRRIFGFDPDVQVTMGMIRAAVHPEDAIEVERVLGGAAEGRDFDLVFRVLTTAGEVRHAHVVGHRIEQITDRMVFLGALQDVTDNKVAEERLDRARRELAHVSRITALSALTASIAHEVNQPLAGIVANASTCLRMLAADPPNTEGARATAQRTIRDANRAAEVVKRLRALFARRPPAREPLDLNDAAREVLTLVSSELEAAHVVLQTDLVATLPTIVGDRVQLQQVMLNLVLNAAEAMRTVDDRPRDLTLSTARDGDDHVRLYLRDAGAGATAEELTHFFDAFYTTKPEGMGIGLSISRSIVVAHGGRIWVEANDGPGLTFCFSIPITPSASTGAEDDGPDPEGA